MAEMDLGVNLIPDKSQLEGATDEPLKQDVSMKGKGKGGGDGGLLGMLGMTKVGSNAGTGGGEGGMLGGLMGGEKSAGMGAMVAKLAVIAGGVMAIAQAVMDLAPMKALMQMINKFIQLLFLPFVMMLFRLLKPILVGLIKLMPVWLKFWQDPVGNLMALAEWIGEKFVELIMDLPGMITQAIGMIPDMITGGTGAGVLRNVAKGAILTNPTLGGPQMALGGKFIEGIGEKITGKEFNINLFGLGTEAEAEKQGKITEEKSGGLLW